MAEKLFHEFKLFSRETSGGEGGTTDYEQLDNKPKINNITILGSKTGSDYGLQDKLTAGDGINISNGTISTKALIIKDYTGD